ncbi:MAG TPA: FUN14 domain-containing protein [Nitrososphaeraceae archaeon]|jgi:uncharacterized membrane protein (Fun14 family)
MLLEHTIATAAFGGLTGFLVGYFIRKIVKVVLFALGGVLSLMIYLQYQGLITVNVGKIQHFTETATSSIANYTNAILHYGTTFGNSPIGLYDLSTPFVGSMTVGLIAGILRG